MCKKFGIFKINSWIKIADETAVKILTNTLVLEDVCGW